MTASTDDTVLSTAFAVLARELLNDLQDIDTNERNDLVYYFLSCQDRESGCFIDTRIDQSTLTSHDQEYVDEQCTYFSMHALDALGAVPQHRISLVTPFVSQPRTISRWLDERDWSRPWYESNHVMFMLYFLSAEVDRGGTAHCCIREALDWFDRHQDPRTGLWGTSEGASLLDGVAGAFHILLFFNYFRRPIPAVNRLIDSVLTLQNADGLFSPLGGGGSCEDLDAVDVLCNARQQTDYRRLDIDKSLSRAARSILECRNADGGFRWVRSREYGARYWMDILAPGSTRPYSLLAMAKRGVRQRIVPSAGLVSYSGIPSMTFSSSESDMWSAWFRPLALYEISKLGLVPALGVEPVFRRQPGLGYFHPARSNKATGLERVNPGDIDLPAAVRDRVSRRYSFASAYVKPESRVLDVGTGIGWGAALLARAGGHVDAVDASEEAIEYATANYASERCRFAVRDAAVPGFGEGPYDLVAVFEVLEHLGTDGAETIIDECRRLAYPNGKLVGSTPTTRGRRGERSRTHGFHEYEFSVNELLALLERGFRHIDLHILTSRDIVFVCSQPRPFASGARCDWSRCAQDGHFRSQASQYFRRLSAASTREARMQQAWLAAWAALVQDPRDAYSWQRLLEASSHAVRSWAAHPGMAGVFWVMGFRRLAVKARKAMRVVLATRGQADRRPS